MLIPDTFLPTQKYGIYVEIQSLLHIQIVLLKIHTLSEMFLIARMQMMQRWKKRKRRLTSPRWSSWLWMRQKRKVGDTNQKMFLVLFMWQISQLVIYCVCLCHCKIMCMSAVHTHPSLSGWEYYRCVTCKFVSPRLWAQIQVKIE